MDKSNYLVRLLRTGMYKNYYSVTKLDENEAWPDEAELVKLCGGPTGFIRKRVSENVYLMDIFLKDPARKLFEVEGTTNI